MEVLSAARAFHYTWSWRLEAAPADLWPLVADTNRFNHDAGVPPVASAHPDFCTLGQGRRELSLRRFGVLIAWEEHAFEWVRPRHFSVLRRYTAGPVAEMRVDVRLEPDGTGTLLQYDVAATPASVLGAAAIPFQIGVLSRRRFAAVFRRYGDATAAQPRATRDAVVLLGGARRPMAPGADVRLDRAAERVGGAAGPWPRLREVLERAADSDADRLRPYALADQWAVPRRDVLQLFLRATRAGVLQLRWDLLCPLCRGTQASADTLAGLALYAHCPCCHVDVSADFDRSVELAFRPTDAVRPLSVAPYCVGGPHVTPHVAVQQLVRAGERRTVDVSLDPGRYRVRALNRPGSRLITAVGSGPATATVALDDSGWCGDDAAVACDATLELHNDSGAAELFIVERLAWTDTAVVAADVFALQEFRDLFSAEALRPGERVMVGAMTILFTDLRESTALYDRIGDAPAFGRVLDHFHALRNALETEHGAIVKTIGDAVMAVFTEPAAAVRTVLRAHEMLAADPDGIQPVQLKCGAHYGSCIAVTLNERLDYFGSTVNTAARLGGLAQGGDIVLSEELFNDPGVTELVARMELAVSSEEVLLKGYSRPVRCYRLRPARVFASRC